MSTIFESLTQQTRRLGDRPAVVFADAQTGERTELSFATLHNWVSKTANLLVDTFDMDLGSEVRVDMPLHWMVPVVAHATWAVGAGVRITPGGDMTVGHEARADHKADLLIGSGMGGRPLTDPGGDALLVTDILAQPDDFLGDPLDEGAWAVDGRTQASLLEEPWPAMTNDRVLHAGDGTSEETLFVLARTLPHGLGVVLARGYDSLGLARLADQENAG
jgi:uncharacterized protein (TIGR03089 family)